MVFFGEARWDEAATPTPTAPDRDRRDAAHEVATAIRTVDRGR